jgi:hypothetical protein
VPPTAVALLSGYGGMTRKPTFFQLIPSIIPCNIYCCVVFCFSNFIRGSSAVAKLYLGILISRSKPKTVRGNGGGAPHPRVQQALQACVPMLHHAPYYWKKPMVLSAAPSSGQRGCHRVVWGLPPKKPSCQPIWKGVCLSL